MDWLSIGGNWEEAEIGGEGFSDQRSDLCAGSIRSREQISWWRLSEIGDQILFACGPQCSQNNGRHIFVEKPDRSVA